MAKATKLPDNIAINGGDDSKGFESFIFLPGSLYKILDKAFNELSEAKVRNICQRQYRGSQPVTGTAKTIKTVVSRRRLLYDFFTDKAFLTNAKSFASAYVVGRISEAEQSGDKAKPLAKPDENEKFLAFIPHRLDAFLLDASQALKVAGIKNKYDNLRVTVGKRGVLYALLQNSETLKIAEDFFKNLTARRIAEQPKPEDGDN